MSYIDNFSAESILVIKKPPTSSPTIKPITLPTQNNFLEERFVCFAYRYEYQNGEFSATSQFSDPAFTSEPYTFSYDSFLNEGMINSSNAAEITYNTGGPLVIAVELLFKEMGDSTIKIIERLDKVALNLGNDNTATYVFDNQKIFTVLPESEILRLYDNVPLKANAQTLMGNRLIYGNYTEGHDLVDKLNNPVKFTYNTELESKDVGLADIDISNISGDYTISGSSITVPESVLSINLSGQPLLAGSRIFIDIQFLHSSFEGQTPLPNETTVGTLIAFDYVLPQAFNSVHELAISDHFIAYIGSSSTIKPMATSCDGTTFTDVFNCSIPNTLTTPTGTVTKSNSGISGVGQAIEIISTSGSDVIDLQIPAVQFVDDLVTPTQTLYEFYQINVSSGTFQELSNNYSLHSNRGYELGIVYMDEFNRSSTAQVSVDNTIHIPCGKSSSVNKIKAIIPGGPGPASTSVTPAQIAPSWATRYKFVIKPDRTTYETIYTSTYYDDPDSNATYFFLEGENANKVEAGDRLIVKTDSRGVISNCTYTTVLEKEAKTENFITIPDPLNPPSGGNDGGTILVPAGVYMKINANNFVIENNEEPGGSFVDEGTLHGASTRSIGPSFIAYPVNSVNPGGTGATSYIDYTVPEGSGVQYSFDFTQASLRAFGSQITEGRDYNLSLNIRSRADYNNFKDFWDGEDFNLLIDNGVSSIGPGGDPWEINYNSTLQTEARDPLYTDMPDTARDQIEFKFFRNSATNQLFLLSAAGRDSYYSVAGISNVKHAYTDERIQINRVPSDTIVFETIPLDGSVDIWYENDLSFAIDNLGQHTGNIQNQLIDFNNGATTTPQDAIIDTGFYNCIAFGNGVESYKIRDSVKGKDLNFGNRVTTTSSQIYKESNRFADLTYSGVFNDESNVNKLNEFNLGLLNFKPLEESFGPIEKLYGRKDDILTLQEDKISYVLVSKDLLSDASGSGVLTSVPTILGKQIPRIEEYGISSNPESFSSYGANKYFTDSKRGAVIKLSGSSFQNDTLEVVSQLGMRGWFRDFFIDTISNQKLGAYDPYMNEYVLATNSQTESGDVNCFPCGVAENVLVEPSRETIYCVNVGQNVGSVVVDYIIPNAEEDNVITQPNTPSTGTGLVDIISESSSDIVTETTNTGVGYTINAYYNNVGYGTVGPVYVSGSITVPKTLVDVTTITLVVTTNSTESDTIQITTGCVTENIMTLYNITLTSDNEATQTIHNEYSWIDGPFSSSVQSNQVQFSGGQSTPVISQFASGSGPTGIFAPSAGATVSMISNKLDTDDFVFDATSNKFQYLRTATTYGNNSADMLALVSAANTATPVVVNGNQNYANFTMPTGTALENKLYMIWDYRDSTSAILNVDNNYVDACCPTIPIGPVVDCGVANAYSGGVVFPSLSNVTLGSINGNVVLDYNVASVPSRILVKYDGIVVIDTGYRGDSSYQGQLNNALASRGLPPEVIAGTGTGTASFTKSTATTNAVIEVYSPLSNNVWTTTLNCPT